MVFQKKYSVSKINSFQNGERLAFLFFVIAMVIPIWLVDLTPLVDMPGHAAQIATFLRLLETNHPLNKFLEINLFNPYVLGYLLIAGLAKVVSLLTAIKLTLSFAVAGFPLASAVLRRVTAGNKYWDWLTIPLGYSFSFDWGFLNFIVGAPLAILYLALCIQLTSSPSRLSRISLFLISLILFLCHFILFAVFCGIGLLIILCYSKTWKLRFLNTLPILLSFPPISMWMILSDTGESAFSKGINWNIGAERSSLIFTLPYSWPADFKHICLAISVLMIPFLMGGCIRWDWKKLLPLTLILVIFFFIPQEAFSASLIYYRFAMFIIPLYLTALTFIPAQPTEPASSFIARTKIFIGIIFAGVISLTVLFQHAQKYTAFQAESEDYSRIMSYMEPEKRVLSLMYEPNSNDISLAYLHFPQWYQALKGGLVDYNFGVLNHMLVRFKPIYIPAITVGFEFNPKSFDWFVNRGWEYDYFLFRSKRDQSMEIFKNADCPVRFVAKEGQWSLFARERGTEDSTSNCTGIHRNLENRLIFTNIKISTDFSTNIDQFNKIDIDISNPISDTSAHWTNFVRSESYELNLNLGLKKSNTDYKTTYVYSEINPGDKPASALLLTGSDDGLTVWHDGKVISQNLTLRAVKLGDDRVPLLLHPGPNKLLFRVNNATGGWFLVAHID